MVDWTKQNIQLAAEFGLTPERIRQLRMKHGTEKPKTYRRRRRVLAIEQLIAEQGPNLNGKTVIQIAKVLKTVPNRSLRNLLKLNGVRVAHGLRIRSFNRMNWELPNKILDSIWDMPPGTAARERDRLGVGPARWGSGHGPAGSLNLNDIVGLEHAMEMERKKKPNEFESGTDGAGNPDGTPPLPEDWIASGMH